MTFRAGTQRDFESLSMKDLLAARDLYHWHLIKRTNVVGTAVGLYLIRHDDPWPSREKSDRQLAVERAGKVKDPRTFSNSEVRDYSWPCVLVFVKEWIDEKRFRTEGEDRIHPEEFIPKTLYMPDGRTVPVCVVMLEPAPSVPTVVPTWAIASRRIGPGFPIITRRQREERRGTIGCLVSDGHLTYALTNRHVCGAAGEPVYASVGGCEIRIGRASAKQATRLPFHEVYPDFPAHRTYVNLDVGLAEIEDLTYWTSQIHGVGPVGELADLHEASIRLELANADVVAFGAASGPLRGKIKGLFYRYRSVGGYDYVTDFLIAPADPQHQTQPGDSGTVWHLAPRNGDELPSPIAVEWGAQAAAEAGAPTQYHLALATSLSSICRHLDVELVRTGSPAARPYWGQVGHYSIATFACEAVRSRNLRELMLANKSRISFTEEGLDPARIREVMKGAYDDQFVPLADVPDTVWKKTPGQVPGGRDTGPRTGPEHPTHYADIDEKNGAGKTLRALCLEDPENLDVDLWRKFYDDAGHTESRKRGLLPFRVWQFFDEMVKALRAGHLDRFVCAAGILSHYVGDACQPLHGSIYADGYADRELVVEHHHRDGTPYQKKTHVGGGVHSAYETNMIDRYAGDLVTGLVDRSRREPHLEPVTTGRDAGLATIRLMDRSANTLPPRTLVDAFVVAGGKKSVGVYDALWRQFKEETMNLMWDGAQVLASLWEGAWKAGDGDALDKTELRRRWPSRLKALYESAHFVPSLDLDSIKAVLG